MDFVRYRPRKILRIFSLSLSLLVVKFPSNSLPAVSSVGERVALMALFVGEFDVVIDGKHRLAIPAPLREQMAPAEDGKDFYLVLGPDRHLCLYPNVYYRRLLGPVHRSPLPDRRSRRFDLLFAMARVLKPDSQGRVVLPEKSMQRAILSDLVTLVGKGDHIEIWPTNEWERYVEQALPGYGEGVLDAGDGFASASGSDK